MNQQTEHTPTPWNNDSRTGPCNITSSAGRITATTGGYSDNFSGNKFNEENEANAALIVKAVNRDHLFDELVALVELLKPLPEHDHPAICARVDAALAKVEA